MQLTNGQAQALVGLSVTPRVVDENGVDVTDRFYLVPPELTGVSAVDGSDSLGSAATMTGDWILVPGEGLGGTTPDGQQYWVKAVISYYLNGRAQGNSDQFGRNYGPSAAGTLFPLLRARDGHGRHAV